MTDQSPAISAWVLELVLYGKKGNTMKKIVLASVVALAFTTGFTCSKNTPAPEATPVTEAPAQEQMAAPAETAPAVDPAATPTTTP